MNMSNSSSFICDVPNQMSVVSILLPIMLPILIIEMIVGLPGNMLALWIFCFRLKWKPHTLFLCNLVLADFLLLVSVPFRVDNFLREENWVFGGVWCRVNLFMLAVNRSASIAFMSAVAVDRYFKVVHPHHRITKITTARVSWVAGLIWVIVISLRVPLLATNLLKQSNTSSICRSFNSYEHKPPEMWIHEVVYIVEFFLPLLGLLFCSARITCVLWQMDKRQRQVEKKREVRRAIRTVGVIVAVFVICFMPGIITGLGAYIQRFRKDCESYKLGSHLFSLSIGFTYLNSSLDPLIYCSSSMFSNALKSSIYRLGTALKPALSESQR